MAYCQIVLDGTQFIDNNGLLYEIPPCFESQIHEGSIVYVPFGKNNYIKQGFVVEKFNDIPLNIKKKNIKTIYMIHDLEPVLSIDMMEFCKYIAEYYASPLIKVLNQAIPHYVLEHFFIEIENITTGNKEKIKKECFKEYVSLLTSNKYRLTPYHPFKEDKENISYKLHHQVSNTETIVQTLSRSPKQKSIVEYILENGTTTYQKIKEKFGNVDNALKALNEKSLLEKVLLNRNFFSEPAVLNKFELNDYQKEAFLELSKDIDKKIYSKNLLNGVTGSGKTLVYIKLIEIALKNKRQVLILIPEITLSLNIYERLSKYFSSEIGVMHSQLSEKEKFLIWNQVKNKKKQIIVGPRSAIFLPFDNLGLVIIDEEHENTFKQNEPDPRYHASVCAEYLAKKSNAVLLLGSATPSLQTLYEVVNKKCRIFNLPERYQTQELPEIRLIDMGIERKKGNKSILSDELRYAINRALLNHEQVILFVNKKGFSSHIQCQECGTVLQCPKCDIPLTYYKSSESMKCNYCDYEHPMLKECPTCGNIYFNQSGVGTENIEEVCKSLFPNACCKRIDGHLLDKERIREKIFREYEEKKIDILVGTQLIAKGLDFQNTTCVGVINADLTLNMPDYRAAERSFQLMIQVAGRAGRDDKKGYVYIQSYQPTHYALVDAKNYDLKNFFRHEMTIRQKWQYPPFIYLIRIIISDTNNNSLENSTSNVMSYLRENLKNVIILGPSYAPIPKKNNRFRMHILIKSLDLSYIQSHMNILRLHFHELKMKKSTRLTIDIEPENIL